MSPAVVNDGSGAPPRLRVDLHLGTIWDLPAWSEGPARGDDLYAVAAAAGFEGIQGGDPVRCRSAGLTCSAFATVREPGGLRDLASSWLDLGFECATLHLGTGHDDAATASRLVAEVLEVGDDLGFPLFVETHRATLTQDLWRTVQLVAQFDDLRFNGDFSHWYTGLEMTYGDWDAKVAFIAPVLERTRFLHGRIGDPGCIQIGITAPGGRPIDDQLPSVVHFRQLWTAAARGFLDAAAPGDVLVFTPELLPPAIDYARTEATPDGRREVSDRWADALRMADIARECFAAAAESPTRTATGEAVMIDLQLHPANTDFSWSPPPGPYRAITEAQARAYDEVGAFVFERALDRATLDAVLAEIDPVEARVEAELRKLDGGKLFIARADAITFTTHLVSRSAVLRDLVSSPPLTDLCADLIGPDVRLYWDQAVYKKHDADATFPWHQDNGYAFVDPQQYLTCWIALTDATEDNGCPQVVPGVHRAGTLSHHLTDAGYVCLDDPPGAVAVPAKAGDIVVFSSLTPHCTGPNLTDGVRKAYIVQYAPDGAAVVATGDDGTTTRTPATDPRRQFPVLAGGRRVEPPR